MPKQDTLRELLSPSAEEIPTEAMWSSIQPNLPKPKRLTALRTIGLVASLTVMGCIGIWQWQQQQEISKLRSQVAELMDSRITTQKLRQVTLTGEESALQNESVTVLIDVLRRDDDLNVRLAAVNYLRNAIARADVRLALIEVLDQNIDPYLAIKIIKTLAQANDLEALPSLEHIAATSHHPLVVAEAKAAIKRIS